MVQVTEQIAALNKSQLEAGLKMAEFAAQSMEKLADVQLKAAKAAYADNLKVLKQFAAAKDVNQLTALSTSMAQPTFDKAASYAKSIYDVMANSQSELASVLEEQVSEFNKNMVVTLDAVMKSAPAGSEGALAAAKSAIHSANTAYETMVKAARQMATVAESNLATVTSHAAPAKKKAA